MSFATSDPIEPYLSVVVTTRNDDHGGDPLKRLQSLVNSFDEQCRRTGLTAEVIVVEWNPPGGRPRVSSLLRLPDHPSCSYRFIEVPEELHQRLRFAEVLPLFQMIAKNVGIRRARGQFVLATNIDIIFSNELIEFIAAGQLQPGRLYRVDRHDMQPDFPVDGSLEEQMAYCASHQLRVHARNGSHPVDPNGQPVALSDDVVDGMAVKIGAGWHVREGEKRGSFLRWAGDAAQLIVDPVAARLTANAVLLLDVESNPYDTASWVEIAASEADKILVTARVEGRLRIQVPIGPTSHPEPRQIDLRVVQSHPESSRHLPVFERRSGMLYRMYSARLAPPSNNEREGYAYPLEGWVSANPESALEMTLTSSGLSVSSDPRRMSYCVKYGPLSSQREGASRFSLTCSLLEGRIQVGVLNQSGEFWIPSTVTHIDDGAKRRIEIDVGLAPQEVGWLVVFNDHPDGYGTSRFLIHRTHGTCDPARAVANRLRGNRARRWSAALTASRTRGWKATMADWISHWLARALGRSIRYRVFRQSQEYRSLEQALRSSDQQLRALAPLQNVADIHRFLLERRPEHLHVNGCGDFQLMAREHWGDLRGYPEFETFSMNIDGLFSYIAHAAGVIEEVLEMPIYHFEHEVGSGWSPEGEAVLRQRIAERGITWVDASTVYVWAAYMRWLQRPMIFNGADWGMAQATLAEHSPSASSGAAS